MYLRKLSDWWATVTPDKIRYWLSAWGGRRFFLSIGAGIATTILAWYAKITGEVYRDVILGTVGIYIAGNTFQKTTEVKTAGTTQVVKAAATSAVQVAEAQTKSGEA